METKRFYLQVDGKIQNPITNDEMADKVDAINKLFNDLGFDNVRGELKENPDYDSFGNLWE